MNWSKSPPAKPASPARAWSRAFTPSPAQCQWSNEVVYLLSSLPLDQIQAQGMLRLKRGYWVIESRLHHCLDSTMQDDLSRVRDPNAARVPGTIRRVMLTFANAAVDALRQKHPKTKANTKRYRQRFLSARRGPHRLHALILSQSPDVLSFPK